MQLICVEPPNADPDHQSVSTVANLITVLLIVGTGHKDNWEEPRQTPDALKTGATGKNLASASRKSKWTSPQ